MLEVIIVLMLKTGTDKRVFILCKNTMYNAVVNITLGCYEMKVTTLRCQLYFIIITHNALHGIIQMANVYSQHCANHLNYIQEFWSAIVYTTSHCLIAINQILPN